MIIGIIGGGQLGMMMAESAKKYNHTIIGLDPIKDCPLSYIADRIIVADYNDIIAMDELIELCDVVTYEFENVDLDLIKKYQSKIPQKSEGLYYSRHRMVEKDFARDIKIPTPKYKLYNESNMFFPAIIKHNTGGYDGKGQWVVKNIQDIDRLPVFKINECIIEEFVNFDYEISVVITRDSFGNETIYPIPRNTHRNGILFTSEVFGDIDTLIVSKAKKYTSKIIKELDYIGTLAVEYFVIGNEVIFNEFAPRPHNSGHYTIEGCTVSQFDNHILAITGNEIQQTELIGPTIMINILGQDYDYLKRINDRNVFSHMYHKELSKPNRKMGHLTIVTNSKTETTKIKKYIIKE